MKTSILTALLVVLFGMNLTAFTADGERQDLQVQGQR